MSLLFASTAAFLYVIATLFIFRYLQTLQLGLLHFARFFVGLGLLVHWGLWGFEIFEKSGAQTVHGLVSDLSFTALAGLVAFVLMIRKQALGVTTVALPVIAVSVLIFQSFERASGDISLPSVWLWTHIGLLVLGEVVFFFSAVIGLLYLILSRQLKNGSPSRFVLSMPSLNEFDRILGWCLQLGLIFMSFGVLLGFIFADRFLEGDWWLEPKIIFAGLSWVVYAVLILLRNMLKSFAGRWSALGALLAFIVVTLFSLGLDQFSGSPHYEIPIKQDSAQP